MKHILSQMIFIARGDDIDGWMNILVFVIVAVVYALGAIIKAKGKKSQEGTKSQLQRKPARKPATSGRSLLEQFIREIQGSARPEEARESRPAAPPAGRKIARPEATVQKYAPETEQATRTKPISLTAKPKLSISTPRVQPDFEEIQELGTSIQALPPDFTSKGVEELVGKGVDMPAEVVESRYLSEVLSDYADPEELRRAILHYEILGKPLSLRDPSGQIIGL